MPSPPQQLQPPNPATITPRKFLRLEHRLFTHAKSPPRPRVRPEKVERYKKVSEANARRALELLLRRHQPGGQVGFRDVQSASDCSQSHARSIIHRLKELKLWVFLPPPETRGRKSKESQHASPQSPHA